MERKSEWKKGRSNKAQIQKIAERWNVSVKKAATMKQQMDGVAEARRNKETHGGDWVGSKF